MNDKNPLHELADDISRSLDREEKYTQLKDIQNIGQLLLDFAESNFGVYEGPNADFINSYQWLFDIVEGDLKTVGQTLVGCDDPIPNKILSMCQSLFSYFLYVGGFKNLKRNIAAKDSYLLFMKIGYVLGRYNAGEDDESEE